MIERERKMETKTLHAIQVLSKIGKIFSKIVMICCIVGFGLCIAGLFGVAAGGEILKLGGVTIKGIIGNTAGLSEGTLYAAMAVGMILCACEAVLAGFAAHYFGRELADGTPFTFGSAKELLRLGILAICMQNFGCFADPAKLVLIFDMLAGRLEIFPMLVLFMPDTWRRF